MIARADVAASPWRAGASTLALLAIVLIPLAMAHRTRADAIDGPPSCPPGSRGQSSHAGQACVPWPCASDAECDGARCLPYRVCTRVAMVAPGGHGGMDRPEVAVTLVVGSCDPARACIGTEEPPPPVVGRFGPGDPTCTEATYCVPEALPDLPPRSTGTAARAVTDPPSVQPPAETSGSHVPPSAPAGNCGCGSAGRAASGAISFALMLAVAIATRRRR